MMADLIDIQHNCNSSACACQGAIIIPSDIDVLHAFRSRLREVFRQIGLNNEQVNEVVLIGDELVSNSLFESHKKNIKEDVILTYLIKENFLHVNVMDFCGGFNPSLVGLQRAQTNMTDYLEQAMHYQSCNCIEKHENGKTNIFNRLGKGLRLVKSFASSFHIFFYSLNGDISTTRKNNTSGSIIKISYSLQ